ncbi:hypothetical protein [Clostridium beijerinckii]|nr:hypothetical protein [Clostridium beijerinckii]NRY61563.1 hypothetical protein [Clostridium beijerinckii]
MFEVICDYYSTSVGYVYLSYEILMSDLKTKRKAKIPKLLKSLVKKGYIQITKVGKENAYKSLKYLFLSELADNNSKPNIDKKANDSKVMQTFNYVIERKADYLYSYTLCTIKNISKITKTCTPAGNDN